MQLGFVIDQSRCIGCHACTVACKSENHVPVGDFRTWVKYTEAGEFPTVKRSFAVLRCNQCSAAPCVEICPVRALEKRPDGIVDVDPKVCIGCKSCMQGCPYDALYLNEAKGTAEKCHFCAHRTERGLAPACAVVCPTEAIIPGDFDDPESMVAQMRRDYGLEARKTEAGTGPNVFYRDAAPAGIDPMLTRSTGGHIWADRHPGLEVDLEEFERLEARAEARTTYEVAHPPLWGGMITGYLFTKSLAAGVVLAAQLAAFVDAPDLGSRAAVGIPLLGLLFLTLTSGLLVADLKRPERFLLILLRPNWNSWLVRGTWFLIGYGGLLSVWLLLGFGGGAESSAGLHALNGATLILAALSAAYTGWLFGQAKGRVLWMQRGLWLRLIVQAVLAGSAVLLLAAQALALSPGWLEALRGILIVALGLQLTASLLEGKLAPKKREAEYARALALLKRGPFARKHLTFGLVLGTVLPVVLLVVGGGFLTTVAAVLALIGLWVEEDVLVRAGQALPIS